MNWRRFKHQCHEAARLLDKGEKIGPALTKAKTSPLLKELGPEPRPNSLASSVLASLEKGNYSEDEARSALNIYAGLDTSELAHKPSRIRRIGIYLLYLTFIYFIIVSIYMLFVVPQTISFYESLSAKPSHHFIWYVNLWYLEIVGIVTLFIIAFLVTRKIKHLFDYREDILDSFLYRWLLTRRLRSSYEHLFTLIQLPLRFVKKMDDNRIVQHYLSEGYSEKEIADSLSILLGETADVLIARSEFYIRAIYVVMAVLIILSIYGLASSVYTSIFSLGAVL
jgi:hypothetical protein